MPSVRRTPAMILPLLAAASIADQFSNGLTTKPSLYVLPPTSPRVSIANWLVPAAYTPVYEVGFQGPIMYLVAGFATPLISETKPPLLDVAVGTPLMTAL